MEKAVRFRALMGESRLVVAPGVPAPLFARLVEEAGFETVFVTGAGISNMNFCLPDYGLITMTENLEIISRINDATSLPLIVDCDDGYGGGLNVYRTVRKVSALDVGALFIEDQAAPKRCGHFEDHRVIPVSAMQGKIKAAKDASLDPDLFVIARTDAISAEGSLDRALERAHAYVEAGADGIFIEAPATEEDMRRVPQELDVPCIINLVESGKTPLFPNGELERMGYRIALYANAVLKASIFGARNILAYLRDNGTTSGADGKLMVTSAERHRLLEKERYQALLKKYQG